MRIRRQTTFTVTDGPVAIVDPGYVYNSTDESPYVAVPDNCALFDDFGGDGNFKVYDSPECLIVDTAPRQFKASTRTEFTQLDGSVSVDSGMIVFVNLADAPVIASNPITCVVHDLAPGEYTAWSEENENSFSHRRAILGIGKSIRLFLAGTDATTINEIEQRVAASLRLKGQERTDALESIRSHILDLHLSGSNDRRLRMLADAVKLTLPRRTRKKAT